MKIENINKVKKKITEIMNCQCTKLKTFYFFNNNNILYFFCRRTEFIIFRGS